MMDRDLAIAVICLAEAHFSPISRLLHADQSNHKVVDLQIRCTGSLHVDACVCVCGVESIGWWCWWLDVSFLLIIATMPVWSAIKLTPVGHATRYFDTASVTDHSFGQLFLWPLWCNCRYACTFNHSVLWSLLRVERNRRRRRLVDCLLPLLFHHWHHGRSVRSCWGREIEWIGAIGIISRIALKTEHIWVC